MATTTLTDTPKHATLRLPSGQTATVKCETPLDVDEIPIIDISGIWSDDLDIKHAIAEQVREASHRIGFFYAQHHASHRNHALMPSSLPFGQGIDPKYAEAAFRQGKRFCDLPMEEKLKVDTKLVPNEYVGYHPLSGYNRNGRKLKDLSEAFNWAYEASYDPEAVDPKERSISIWPEELPGFKDDLCAYWAQMLRLARRMTHIFALALRMPEDHFDEYVKRPEAGMRVIHYPEQEAASEDQNGIGAHTDFECFTMVTQDDCGGLEVLNKQGYWIRVRPVPDTVVVNIADCFMRQTNDFFVSTVHRVVNKSGRERYSLPFFFGFDRNVKLEPIPTCVSEENPMKYPVMSSGEYYKYRALSAKATAG